MTSVARSTAGTVVIFSSWTRPVQTFSGAGQSATQIVENPTKCFFVNLSNALDSVRKRPPTRSGWKSVPTGTIVNDDVVRPSQSRIVKMPQVGEGDAHA